MSAFDGLELGYDIPALPGLTEDEIETPCLILDLDALERNLRRLGEYVHRHGMRLRVHGKMHKSADVYALQQRIGGATGLCCQKVSEAEAFIRAGVRDVLVSNEVRGARKIDRLARLPLSGAKVAVCVDDPGTVAELSEATRRHGTQLDCLIELEGGAGRCGVTSPEAAVGLAHAITAAPGLRFAGLQAYNGGMQHLPTHAERKARSAVTVAATRATLKALTEAGFTVETVTGGGTGSYELETASGIYTELECGSYAFMDADYGRVLTQDGQRLDARFENALFLLTSVMSKPRPGLAVVDAGLKVQSVDSGLPVVWGRDDVRYVTCSDEHGNIDDPQDRLHVGDRLKLVPGHCDPTCNLHDWYVGLRSGTVECLWPVTARGKAY